MPALDLTLVWLAPQIPFFPLHRVMFGWEHLELMTLKEGLVDFYLSDMSHSVRPCKTERPSVGVGSLVFLLLDLPGRVSQPVGGMWTASQLGSQVADKKCARGYAWNIGKLQSQFFSQLLLTSLWKWNRYTTKVTVLKFPVNFNKNYTSA